MLHQPKVRVGDTLESAVWLTGDEPAALIDHHKVQVEAAIEEANEKSGAVTGPLRWVEKLPGTDRVPPVPDHVSGSCVRLLVAECDVLAIKPSESKFLAELEPSDLRRLRKITREAHKNWWAQAFPGQPWPRPSDRQCDSLINDLGPEAGLDALRKGWTRLAEPDSETVH